MSATKKKTALVVVDMQNDFVNFGGSLYVKESNSIIKPILNLIKEKNWNVIVFTQDWHPLNHVSFEVYPKHCVQSSFGAEITKEFKSINNITETHLKKGYDMDVDSLSAFVNIKGEETGLDAILSSRGISRIVVVGVALELCVYETCIDAVRLGYEVGVIESLTKPLKKSKKDKTLKAMGEYGIKILHPPK